jgi:hypothetical protein
MRSKPLSLWVGSLFLASAVLFTGVAAASSHREAPAITEMPKVDGTDFYMFNSYEPGRAGYVTLIANYIPLQDAYGGPNYFGPDPDALYNIHIDNTGDGVEDLSFSFDFAVFNQDIAIPVGDATVSIPLLAAGQFLGNPGDFGFLNEARLYLLSAIRGPFDHPTSSTFVTNVTNGGPVTASPNDNAGLKTFPDYAAYANRFINDIQIPGCGTLGRVFAGQRKESFQVNLGEVFDLVNLNPVGDSAGERSVTEYANVFTLALEVPADCLTDGGGNVIGGWTTASLRANRVLSSHPTYENPANETGGWVQVSRLGMPLVNEVVIGVKDKNKFNASRPADDLGNFATYVTNPALPELLEILFGVSAPNNFPRLDLVAAFVTGVEGLNEFGIGEMQRLNVAIPATAKDAQSPLGVLGGDNAGFPNGRRPGDDVVDIELRVAMGVLCHAFPGVFCSPADAPSGTLPYTDGAAQHSGQFDDTFPYLKAPVPGSPNSVNGVGEY